MPFLAGLMLGLAGSGHCAVMCGPLVAAFGRRAGVPAWRSITHALTYHGGRLSTYLVAGAGAGLLGRAVVAAGFSRWFAVALGVFLIASAIVRVRHAQGRQGLWSTVSVRFAIRASAWSRRHPVIGPALMGAANGLLPCGLLYAALVAAAGLGQFRDALVFMSGFGIGTVPALVAVGAVASWLPKGAHRFRSGAPLVLAAIGLLLIVRGLTGGHVAHTSGHLTPAAEVAGALTHTHIR